MTVYTIAAQKGGVGKSTTAHALGHGLILRGMSVLFVDLDPQGNLGHTMGADEGAGTASDLLHGRISIHESIVEVSGGFLIPAESSLSAADMELTAVGKEYRLREALAGLSGRFDCVVVDTPPSLGILTVNAITACDQLIVPSQADVYSLRAVGQLNDTIEAVRKYCNPRLNVAGILLTRHSSRSILSRDMSDLLGASAAQIGTRVFDSIIREGVAIREAQALRQDIFSYAPKSNAAQDYGAFVDEILSITTDTRA